ncbi:MAG: hypothetical protein E7116_00975 [Bacteroidales bacterium]|nr:hypothetical protein [Bacteroidales bacterium]
MLAADLFICSIWLMLALHVGSAAYYPLLWTVPMLRMWLSFLTYRRSRMALTPLLLLVVFCFGTLLNHANPVFMLFNRPILAVVKSLIAFFGSGHFDLAEFSDIWYGSWDYRYWIAGIAYVWVVVIPAVVYVYRCFKGKLVPSPLGIWKRVGLVAYIIASIVIMSVFVGGLGTGSVSVLALFILLMLIPVIFNKGRIEGFFTRFEQSFVLFMLMFGLAYSCGVSYNSVSAITTAALPAAFMTLVNWNMGRKTDYKDVLLLVLGASVFYIAQYGINMIRIILLLISLGLFAVAIARFAYSTRRYWSSVALYVVVSLVIPVFCIGYNPFSVLEARKVRHFDDYGFSRHGIMLVTGSEGDGIRDRYGLILPAEYYYIDLLIPTKPYCKVRKLDGWKIYDLEKKMFVSDEEFTDVIPYGEYSFLLKSEQGDRYLKIPHVYSRFSDRGDAVIIEEAPEL